MIYSDQYVKIHIVVNVNGFKRGDVIVVDRDNELFMGFVSQKLAEVVEDGV